MDNATALRDAAKIEIGPARIFKTRKFKGFADTSKIFMVSTIAGIAVQRLMNEGYGFGARR
jgi:L-arabinose isomerase